ncbi:MULTISPECIES: TetR/AcrR family transcriptional regulator [unclassified Streptomyces]|uniref:TetR/AcrR family transcriptional regulator n=1 Tax=unclassified Streptomyces TaxID=2593676 RepID=UPI0022562F87|nr:MULTISPECIES: TetR/AcrR family transcriptional regulator [unclassified Streptomyces]MCX4525946.1 TetR family transcriptional regulator [Streptomyces sp. NBC_01551]MCX4543491.1 TetR family transcriptional regulator [Streptomyces sp. NBC_01565]
MPESPQAQPKDKKGEKTSEAAAAPRRRQARGERRIAQLLAAAAGVFCRTGYAAASTNAIAREAGVSPGTLYQFFPNKEAIAVELGGQLLHRAHEMHGQAFLPENLAKPLPELLDAVLDPVIAFNCENPAFWALMHGSGVPGIQQEHEELHSSLLTRVEGVMRSFCPDSTPAELARVSNMVLGIFKSSLDLILATEGAERAAYVAELKTVLLRYVEPMITTSRPH